MKLLFNALGKNKRQRIGVTIGIIMVWQLVLAPGLFYVVGLMGQWPVPFSPWAMYDYRNSGFYGGHVEFAILMPQMVSLLAIVLTMMISWVVIDVNRDLDKLQVDRH